MADTAPLARLLEQSVDEDLLQAIAEAYARGRRLYVGTTNLDSQQPVIWDMGAIAGSGHPDALNLFRKVMLASASIPIVFPPVYIEVAVDGTPYDEMHVDGGVITEVFFHGLVIDIAAAREELFHRAKPDRSMVYVIRNAKIEPEPEQVEPKLQKIIERTVATMTKTIAAGDLQRIYMIAKRQGIEFYYVGIPQDYVDRSVEPFDPAEMKRLFDIGYQMANKGYEWRRSPPVKNK